jgi:hypothetical protein
MTNIFSVKLQHVIFKHIRLLCNICLTWCVCLTFPGFALVITWTFLLLLQIA